MKNNFIDSCWVKYIAPSHIWDVTLDCTGNGNLWHKGNVIGDFKRNVELSIKISSDYPVEASSFTTKCNSKVTLALIVIGLTVRILGACFKVNTIDGRTVADKGRLCCVVMHCNCWWNIRDLMYDCWIVTVELGRNLRKISKKLVVGLILLSYLPSGLQRRAELQLRSISF